MNRALFLRIVISLFLLSFAVPSYSQNHTQDAAKSSDASTTDIVYTGKFLGYFRVPSLQEFRAPSGCLNTSAADSQAATEFLIKRKSNDLKNAILVGTGDNFAPELEARVFENPDPLTGKLANTYRVGNKELYVSDVDKWVFYKNVKPSLNNTIKAGLGTIHTDNVGCFLRAARYAAIVPGKHDFYFGPERVRQLARFLARTETEYGSTPVQMLGANLVLKTTPIADKPIPANLKEKPWFTPDWSEKYPVKNLSDGGSVYSWFSYVKIQIGKLPTKRRSTKSAAFGV